MRTLKAAAMILSLVAAVALAPTAATATPIISVVVPGDLALTMITETANPSILVAFDVRGTALLSVSDPDLIGGLYITDGVAFGGPPPNNENRFLWAVSIDLLQGGILTMSTPTFGGPGATMLGAFYPMTPVTDPALMSFSGAGPYEFGFAFVGAVPGEDGRTTSTWSLTSVATSAVPDRGTTLSLLAVGILGLLGARRNLRKTA